MARAAASDFKNAFTSAEVRAFWDGVADIYDRANDTMKTAHDQRYRESYKYFPADPPGRILNVWSRTGEAVDFLRDKQVPSTLINLEVSPRLLKKAIHEHKRIGHYTQIDLMDLPIRSSSIDLVWSLETLEHCPDPKRFVQELHRVLKDDGILILSCPPAFAEVVLRIYETFAFNHGEGPHRFLSSRRVKRLLAECDFELLDHRGTLFLPFGNPLMQRLDELVEKPVNRLGLSDLGIRQFFHARKVRGH